MCHTRFVGEHAVKYASRKYETADSDKEQLNFVSCSVRKEPERIWNAGELKDAYLSKGGTDSNISCITNRLRHFVASHWNYARDGTVYLRSLEKLPNTLLNSFLEGKHVVQDLK